MLSNLPNLRKVFLGDPKKPTKRQLSASAGRGTCGANEKLPVGSVVPAVGPLISVLKIRKNGSRDSVEYFSPSRERI